MIIIAINRICRHARNAAILLVFISILSYILYIFDKLELIYLITIDVSIGFIEMGIVLLMLKSLNDDINSQTVSIPKGKINHRLIIAKTNIFQKNLISTNPIKESIFRISVEASEKIKDPIEFSIMRTNGNNIFEEKIVNCLGEGINSINIKIGPKEMLNFMFDKDIKVVLFEVEELYTP